MRPRRRRLPRRPRRPTPMRFDTVAVTTGGGPPPPSTEVPTGRLPGRAYPPLQAPGTNGALVVDRLVVYPFPRGAVTAGLFDGIRFNVTGNVANAVIRLGVYDDTFGRPGALIVDLGPIGAATTGEKIGLFPAGPLVLPPFFWYGGVGQTAAANVQRAALVGNTVIGAVDVSATGLSNHYSQVLGAGAALPDPWGATFLVNGANSAPIYWMETP